jgi:hypothetical protein
MKRFLDGDNLPQNLLDDLEKHLKVCTSCQAILNNENANIEEILDGVAEPKGVAAWMGKLSAQPATASGFVTAGAGEALMSASYKSYAPQAPGMAAFKNPKVLFLSISLAVVLIVMSTLLKNPTSLLGTKATAGNLYSEPKEEEKAAPEEHTSTDEKSDEHPVDEHATEETSAHGEETQTTSDEHATEDTHAAEPKKQPELVSDPRVPGEPTLDQSDLIVVGGHKPEATKKDEHKASTTTAPKKTTTTPPKKQSTTRKSTSPKRSSSSTKKPTSAAKKPSGGGITVYDENGKPIR